MKADKDDLDQQELARQLAALPQPAPSAALDAAILAAVQADLAAAPPRPAAANDAPLAPPAAQAPTRQRWTRWQLPLGLAASFVLSLSVVMKLQEHEAQVVAPQPPAAPSPAPAPAASPDAADAADTAVSTPAAQSAAPATQRTTAGTRNRTQAENSRPALPPNAAAPPMPVESAPAQEFRRAPQAVPELKIAVPAAPAMPSYSQPSPASAFSPAPAPAAAPSLAVPPAPPAPPPPPPPPVPHIMQDRAAPAEAAGRVASERRVEITGSKIMRSQPNAVSPDIWLAAIDEMLKAGLRRDALAEWPRFRQAYPDYPVPQELLERLQVPKD